jgi:cobalt-zinc-cadmium efflux system membrane fusion protein
MKHPKFSLILIIATILSCSRKEATEATETPSAVADAVALTEAQIKNANITVGLYEEIVITSAIQVSGRLEAPPQNMATVSTPFAGFIKSIDLLQGMTIKKGQVVAELQHPDYITFQQNYLELKSELEFLETEYQRQQELSKDNINAQKTVQSAKSNYMVVKAKFDGLRTRLNLMNLDLSKIEKGEFSSTMNLYSPFDGSVTEVNVNLGQFVNPSDVIVKIVDTRHLHVELKIFEKDIFRIKQGQTVSFTLNGDSQSRTASVYLIGKEISPDRTIMVHGHLEKEDPQLLPGMFLTAEIKANPRKVKVIPEEALVKFGGESFVFAAEGNGKFRLVKVGAGISQNGKIEVDFPDNVNAQAKLILSGGYSLLSMMKNGEPEF